MKKKTLAILCVAVLTGSMIAGCGSKQESTDTADTTEETEEAEEAEEADEEETEAVVDQDAATYEDIIASLEDGQAYAYADMDEKNDALLVTDYTYDNLDGNMAAIDATIYDFDADGNVIEYGTVSSDGTAYPLACKDGYLYYGGNHGMYKVYIDEDLGSVMTKECAEETFDSTGKATYSYMSLDDEFEGEVEDDTDLMRLYDEYDEATVINFTVVGGVSATAGDPYETDHWKVTYDSSVITANAADDPNDVTFVYTNEAVEQAGSNFVEISYVEGTTCEDLLKQKMADHNDTTSEIEENNFGAAGLDSYFYMVPSEKSEGSGLQTGDYFTAIPDGDGVVLLEAFRTVGTDDEAEMTIDAAFETMADTLEIK